jgi:hypothetical protein
MKLTLLAALCFFLFVELKAQTDKSLAVTGGSDLRFIIGIIIAVLVIIAMYVLLRKNDK